MENCGHYLIVEQNINVDEREIRNVKGGYYLMVKVEREY